MASKRAALLQLLRRITSDQHPGTVSDAALLRRFANCQDQEAFAALVERHGPMVLRVCRRMLADPHLAEDAFQATFLVLARRAGTLRHPQRLLGWIHGVAYRIARKVRTAAALRQRRETPAMDMAVPDPRPDPLAEVSVRELLRIVDEEVQRLPEAYRLPVILCCLEGHTHEEAARLLGWTPGSFRGRLERGRARLRERLVARGVSLPAALTAVGIGQSVTAAEVSMALATATVRAATAFAAADGAMVGMIPTQVVHLAQGALKGMAIARLKMVAVVMLFAGAIFGGASLTAHQAKTGPVQQAALPPAPGAAHQRPDPAMLPRTDVFGDPLPSGAIARIGTSRFRHFGPVNGVAYSPDGKLLATAGTSDRQVRLWEAATGRLLASVPGENTAIFTRDNRRLFHGGGNIQSESKFLNIPELREESSSIFTVYSKCLALSPDGRFLALNTWSDKPPYEVSICDVTTGKIQRTLKDHPKPVSCIAYSPDGRILATATDDAAVRLWDTTHGELRLRLDGHKPIEGYGGHMLSVAFSPDGKQLVSGGVDKTVRLWDVASGREIRQLGEHRGGVLCVAFTPHGKQVLTGGFAEPIRLWDVTTGKEVQRFGNRSRLAARLAFVPGGTTVAFAHWGSYAPRFWDLASGLEVSSARGPELEINGIVFSGDGKTLTTAVLDGSLQQWDTSTGRELGRWKNGPQLLYCLASAPDGRTVAGGARFGIICLWQADTGQELGRFKGPKGYVIDLAFSPDGKTLASAGDDGGSGAVSLWDVATGMEIRRFPGHTRCARGVAFSQDGRTLVTTAEDQTVRLWQVHSGKEILRLATLHSQNYAVALSPDGSLVLVGSSGQRPIQAWELATGRELSMFDLAGYQQRIFSLAFSPDGRMLAAACEDGVVRLLEVATGRERRRFTGHTGWVSRVQFAPDGRRLASASNDTTTVVWDLTRPASD